MVEIKCNRLLFTDDILPVYIMQDSDHIIGIIVKFLSLIISISILLNDYSGI